MFDFRPPAGRIRLALITLAPEPGFFSAVRPASQPMTAFYWVMSGLIVSTLLPSVMYILLYAGTGEPACLKRAQALWNVSRVLTLLSFNLLIWGHVLVALWQIWFR